MGIMGGYAQTQKQNNAHQAQTQKPSKPSKPIKPIKPILSQPAHQTH